VTVSGVRHTQTFPTEPAQPPDILAIHRRLMTCESAEELVARVADLAPATCGFDRAVVLTVEHGRVTSAMSHPLADRESDCLRRRLLAEPIALCAGTQEQELLRLETSVELAARRPSMLSGALELNQHAYGVIAPDAEVLALLLVDRVADAVRSPDLAHVAAFAAAASLALERVLLRERVAELSRELQCMVTSVQALGSELLRAPLSLPSHSRHGSVFPAAIGDGLQDPEAIPGLTQRERQVMKRLVEGRSNRQIAEEFVISTETVKIHVRHLLRKLNASNRAEAVGRYLKLTG
jgi:LuxR family transcriptional regulator, regulator of acetate metabolism